MHNHPKYVIVYGTRFRVFKCEYLEKKNSYLWTLGHRYQINKTVPAGYLSIRIDHQTFVILAPEDAHYLITRTSTELPTPDEIPQRQVTKFRKYLVENTSRLFSPVLFFNGQKYTLQSVDFDEGQCHAPTLPCHGTYTTQDGGWLTVTVDVVRHYKYFQK
jgi:glutaredoxin